jgi:hypothetical protein
MIGQRKNSIGCNARCNKTGKTQGPTYEVLGAGNSDRGGSLVRSDFQSLKTKHPSLNNEPKEPATLGKASRNSGGGGGRQTGEQKGSEGRE